MHVHVGKYVKNTCMKVCTIYYGYWKQ